ncbi:hypothetical protein RRG08_046780 [Elysia crispata]|uniref:Uncharacterized protein n=1 Tax=Elysia crispata TaxID=231223 RepID=A0AAE1DNN9_9GAST|nr:hypothetical protein RRG08_046780 [Elysia crispata]
MAEEKPVPWKKHKRLRHSSGGRKCIIHNNNLHDYGDVKPFTDYGWEKTFTYTRFLKKRAGDDQEATCSQRKKRATETSGTLFSKDMCIICEKRSKYVKRKSEKLVKCITETAKKSIEEAAERKDDSRLKGITGNYCLVAKEAHYHDSCRREYTRKDDRHQAATDPALLKSEKAQADAFTHIKGYVQKYIIENSQVERMTMLTEKYCLYMQSHHPEVYNPNYKTYKLKEKLLKAFGSKLQFWQPNYRSELVFSAEVPKGCAVEAAFECASSDERRLEEAALVLRRLIFDSFKNAPEMPWPPSADYLLSDQIQVPAMLTKFLRSLLSKRASASTGSIRCDRLVQSIGQDTCYNVTCGQWKLPKQLLLGMTVRHITGSAQLINILNHFGHCNSHSTLLELETAMCDAVVQSPTNIPAGVVKDENIVTQFCWDNFDMNEETPSGAGTTHSTHGIVIQEVKIKSAVTEDMSVDAQTEIELAEVEDESTQVIATSTTMEHGLTEVKDKSTEIEDESREVDEEVTEVKDYPTEKSESEPMQSQRKRSKRRSAVYTPVEIQPCFVGLKVEPHLTVSKTEYEHPPLWCEDDFLPKELLDIITEDNCSENEDSIDDEGELSDASSDKIMSSEDKQSDDDF